MNSNYKLDIAYIAGLFDGEGNVSYKKYPKKRKGSKKDYMTWNIRLEISMTDKNVIELVHETLGVGTIRENHLAKGNWVKKCNIDGDVPIEMLYMCASYYGLISRLSYIR